ncbi:ATG5 [Cordylochernes scorpioides]|uniref:Autophagy protein 5 n=1 Tax=Cordylochernes scorpioides TaxID=51811 RepID=A0ABY6LML2_9ARAC|nr:ATG5 [Cordylochernes scorpioides]
MEDSQAALEIRKKKKRKCLFLQNKCLFQMAEDREVLREVWEGKIPVCIRLAQDEVDTLKQPEPYLMMVPRLTYLPLVIDKVKKHFSPYVRDTEGDMWLEADNGQPLKWSVDEWLKPSIPDIHETGSNPTLDTLFPSTHGTGHDNHAPVTSWCSRHYPMGLLFDLMKAEYPCELIARFKNYPEDKMFLKPNKAAVESHFIYALKEADTLKHRKQIVGNMQKRDTNQLWLGFCNHKFDQFWAVNKLLMDHPPGQTFKAIPFRIYRDLQEPFLQRLVTPQLPTGEYKTLSHLLEECLGSDQYIVVTHGIDLSPNTPLQWLSEHFSFPDNFLHLCVFPKS